MRSSAVPNGAVPNDAVPNGVAPEATLGASCRSVGGRSFARTRTRIDHRPNRSRSVRRRQAILHVALAVSLAVIAILVLQGIMNG